MLFMQLAGLENQQIDSPLMRGLFALRCVVSVGYIYLCRTKAISFRNLNKEQPAITATGQQPTPPAPPQPAAPLDYQQLAQELAPLLQAVRMTIIEEVKASITGPENENARSIPASRSNQQRVMLLVDAEKKQEQANRAEKLALPVTERLEAAYQELTEANPEQRVSGRALAKRAHVDRQTCAAWLKTAHPENMPESKIAANLPQVTATAMSSQPEPEVTAIALEPAATTTELQLAATASEERPQPEATTTEPAGAATATTGQPQPEATATVPAQQPEEEKTTEPEPESITSQGQPEVTATETQPGTDTGSDSQPEPAVTATEEQPPTATGNQSELTITATEPEPQAKETTTRSRPRPKATATQRRTAQPRQKATATRSKSK